MDYGDLLFDEADAEGTGMAVSDFDFYGFVQTPDNVMARVLQQQQQQQQQQHPRQQSLPQQQEDLQRHHGGASPGKGSGPNQSHHGSYEAIDQGMAFATPHAFSLASPVPSSGPAPASAKPTTLMLASNHHAHHQYSGSSLGSLVPDMGGLLGGNLSGNISSNEGAGSSHSKRLERRGHTKSRRGCFNCKRRRIKCQETRPACGHCLKTGLQCEYPVAPLVNHQPQHQIPLFSLQDMRFFQHFLLHCSPHHPLGSKSLWTHEIPCLSHSYDYLMHALLGMAASDLMQDDPSLVTAAMDHRIKAIRAIKRTLAAVPKWPSTATSQVYPQHAGGDRSGSGSVSPPAGGSTATESRGRGSGGGGRKGSDARTRSKSRSAEPWELCGGSSAPSTSMFEEGNALLATCLALTFQSVALDDGMAEYMTFIRGIIVVAIQMYHKGARIMFRNLLGSEQTELLRPAIEPMSAINRQWSAAALTAIQMLAPLCAGDSVATAYHALVVEMAEALLVSPMEAYSAMVRHYAWWMQLPHEQFRQVIDLDRPVFVLLATHWIALKQIMARITSKEEAVSAALSRGGAEGGRPELSTEREDGQRAAAAAAADGSMDPGIARWLKHLNRQVEPEYLAYNKWPMWVESELDQDLCVFSKE